jgi:hypothetical protein
MSKKKIKITGIPELKYGGQVYNPSTQTYSLDTRPDFAPRTDNNPYGVNFTLQPVSTEEQNYEAERHETLLSDDGNLFTFGGKPHSEGGTAGNMSGYIFPQTKKMKIKDPELLALFGKTKPMTPADISKQYKMNEYKAVMGDENADPTAKKTAEMNYQNGLEKLTQLATITEAMKGLPNGLPQIGVNATGEVQAKYGGYFKNGGAPSKDKLIMTPYGPRLVPSDKTDTKKVRIVKAPQAPTGEFRFDQNLTPEELPDMSRWAARSFLPASPQYHPSTPNLEEDLATVPAAVDPNVAYTQMVPYAGSPAVASEMEVKEKGSKGKTKTEKTSPAQGKGWSKEAMASYIAHLAGAPVNNYGPVRAVTNLTAPDFTYFDPTRELAKVAETANTQAYQAAQFGSPQSAASVLSSVWGNALPAVGDIFGKYNNLNVGVANQEAQAHAETANKQAMLNTQNAQVYNDQMATFQQNKNNSFRDYMAEDARLRNAASDEQKHYNWMNQTNPWIGVTNNGNPYLKQGVTPEMVFTQTLPGQGSSAPSLEDRFAYYVGKGLDAGEAMKFARQDVGYETTTYDPTKGVTTQKKIKKAAR